MAKARNQRIYSNDVNELTRLADEYSFVGRRVNLDVRRRELTVFALPETWKKKIAKERRLEALREARHGWEL